MAKKDFGAGLRLSADNIEDHPAGPPKNEGMSQTERMWQVGSTLLSGILAINASQWIGAPLKFINPEYYDAYMAFTKQSFAVLTTTMTQWWAPTVVRVSGDASMHGQLQQLEDGSLQCNFPDRLVMMANHQLYTDWLYLWWIAYTNGMHGRIHIIMKESLKKIPFIGWGAQFYNFIFVARKWEEDKSRFEQHLQKLNKASYPMWLIIFPEGTNLSAVTRETSKQWAEKNGLEDMKHQLLPRSTGLRFCLQNLRKTTPWLYDCTIGYEGIPPGKFGQDIFTLRSSFFEGRPPKSVNMHWRRFRVADIPIDDERGFEVWLRNRWREKDYMLEYFTRNGRFPVDHNWMLKQTHQKVNGDHGRGKSKTESAKYIETQVKSKSWEEFLLIFAPIGAFVIVLFLFYSASQVGEKNSPLNDVPEEWRDVMGQASKLLNSMSKLSDVQNGIEVAQAAAAAETGPEEGIPAPELNRPNIFRSSSTDVSSQTGAKAKYRFVPSDKAKTSTNKAVPVPKNGPAGVQKQAQQRKGTVVPIKVKAPQAAVSPRRKPVSKPKINAETIKLASGLNLKVNAKQTLAKPRPAKTAPTTKASLNEGPTVKVPVKAAPANIAKPITQKGSSVASIKPSDSISNTGTQAIKKPKTPLLATSSQTDPPVRTPSAQKVTGAKKLTTAASNTGAKPIPSKQKDAAQGLLSAPKPAKSDVELPSKPKAAPFSGKMQLANGMWVNVPASKPVTPAPRTGSGSRQLANGVRLKS